MFAKIFAQIFDSSIAQDYLTRHVFMDLLVLADRDGVVDMTVDAISRRTNVPENLVAHAIQELMGADDKSRSPLENGKRIVPLDSHRDWGWQIVNYEHYRTIRDDESRRSYFRDYKREYRQSKKSTKSPQVSTSVLDCPTMSTKAEVETDTETDTEKKQIQKKPSSPSAQSLTLYGLYPRKVGRATALKAIDKALKVKPFDELLLAVKAFGRKLQRDGTEEQFIPHPATWFNAGRYDDEEFKPNYSIKPNGGSSGKIDRNTEAAARLIASIEDRACADRGELFQGSGDDGFLLETDGKPPC